MPLHAYFKPASRIPATNRPRSPSDCSNWQARNGRANVLNCLLAEKLEGDGEFPFDLIKSGAGDANAARFSQLLKLGSDVHAVAISRG